MSSPGSSCPKKPTVLVIGSLNMDLATHIPRVPIAGETLLAHADGFRSAPGGKGANQAVALARLGGDKVRCAMVGMVGDDGFGKDLRGALQREGVDVTAVGVEEGKSSGVAVILIEDSGQNRIMVSMGANSSLSPSHIPRYLAGCAPAMVVLQHEIPLDTVSHAIKLYSSSSSSSSSSSNTLVLLNPAPAVDPATLAAHGIDLSNVDFFIPNETEACISYAGYDAISSVVTVAEAGRLAKAFLVEKGVKKAAIVTLGEQGVVVAYYDNEGKVQMEHVAAQKVDVVVDTVGAGDTFTSGFAVSFVEGHGIVGSVKRGIEASARTVQKKGAMDSVPTRADLGWV